LVLGNGRNLRRCWPIGSEHARCCVRHIHQPLSSADRPAHHKQPLGAIEVETHYTVEIRCHGPEEAHIRALLLQAAASAGLGLRRLTSENLEDSPQVTVSALLVSGTRHDAALEQIIGRMSLEPFVTAVHWQAEQAAAES